MTSGFVGSLRAIDEALGDAGDVNELLAEAGGLGLGFVAVLLGGHGFRHVEELQRDRLTRWRLISPRDVGRACYHDHRERGQTGTLPSVSGMNTGHSIRRARESTAVGDR